jgi:subtilisin family serine protease
MESRKPSCSHFGLVLAASALMLGGTCPSRAQSGAFYRMWSQRDCEAALAEQQPREFPRFPDGRTRVMLELEDEAAAAHWLQSAGRQGDDDGGNMNPRHAAALAQTHLARLLRVQHDVLASILAVAPTAKVVFTASRLYNGIALDLPSEQLAHLRTMPGVRRVRPLQVFHLDTSLSVPFLGAPELWAENSLDLTGKAVRVAIIDTGIDYHHADFGGTGDYQASYTSPDWPRSAKVVGGFDFVGNTYNPASFDESRRIPRPDPNPMDECDSGHGTHVAGIVAGYGVLKDGQSYQGPYGPQTDFSKLEIGPGMAPEAELLALRVFGCAQAEGEVVSTDQVIPALEWAVDPNGDGDFSDHVDIVNLSLGSPFGSTDDPTAIAVERASQVGVLVVAAAGNSGDLFSSAASPAVAPSAVAVASSSSSGHSQTVLRVNTPSLAHHDSVLVPTPFSASLPPDGLTGELAAVVPEEACQAITGMAGKIAFIQPGNCSLATKARNSQEAGCFAAILVASSDDDLSYDPETDGEIRLFVGRISGIDGVRISNALLRSQTTAQIASFDQADMMSWFSSRGPSSSDGALKPEITAPGQAITSAKMLSGNQAVTLSGTSMAAPHVSGALALLRQLHLTWSVEELKALIMNTSTGPLYLRAGKTPPVATPSLAGAGRLDVRAAATAPAVALFVERPGGVALSFGYAEVVTEATREGTVEVTNRSAQPLSYRLSYVPAYDHPGVSVSFPGDQSVEVAPGRKARFVVRLTAAAASMKPSPDPSAVPLNPYVGRRLFRQAAGTVLLTPPTGQVLRLPLYALPRPASRMSAVEASLGLPSGIGEGEIHLHGLSNVPGGTADAGSTAAVSAFELREWDSAAEGSRPAAIGVASNAMAMAAAHRSFEEATVTFALVYPKTFATPSEVTAVIPVDTNRDGVAELSVMGLDVGDLVFSVVCPTIPNEMCYGFAANGLYPKDFDTALYNTNVLFLPVPVWALGLADGDSQFQYWVPTEGAPRTYSFDPAHPGITISGRRPPGVASQFINLFADVDGNTLTVGYDEAAYQANHSQGVLLLHHHNVSGMKAELLPVAFGPCLITAEAVVGHQSQVGENVTFHGTATVSGCNEQAAFRWDSGDGSPPLSGADVIKSYAERGTYRWSLTVSAGATQCVRTGMITVADKWHVRRRLGGNTAGAPED